MSPASSRQFTAPAGPRISPSSRPGEDFFDRFEGVQQRGQAPIEGPEQVEVRRWLDIVEPSQGGPGETAEDARRAREAEKRVDRLPPGERRRPANGRERGRRPDRDNRVRGQGEGQASFAHAGRQRKAGRHAIRRIVVQAPSGDQRAPVTDPVPHDGLHHGETVLRRQHRRPSAGIDVDQAVPRQLRRRRGNRPSKACVPGSRPAPRYRRPWDGRRGPGRADRGRPPPVRA